MAVRYQEDLGADIGILFGSTRVGHISIGPECQFKGSALVSLPEIMARFNHVTYEAIAQLVVDYGHCLNYFEELRTRIKSLALLDIKKPVCFDMLPEADLYWKKFDSFSYGNASYTLVSPAVVLAEMDTVEEANGRFALLRLALKEAEQQDRLIAFQG